MLDKLVFPMVLVFASMTASFAAEISLTEVIFERPGGSILNESKMLKVHFIDIGGGDGILIDTPTDKKILIDGGYTWGERGKASKEASPHPAIP